MALLLKIFIHPSKEDSLYSHFLSPFSKGEWVFGKKIHSSKKSELIHPWGWMKFSLLQIKILGVFEGRFTLKGEPFLKADSTFHSPFEKGDRKGE